MEQFVFDALPLAERTVTQEVPARGRVRAVKNATGPDSRGAARAALSAQGQALDGGGRPGRAPRPPRSGPLFALDQDEFLAKLHAATRSGLRPS
jgi:hypothetical protein